MAKFVKEGNRVIVLLAPSENESEAASFVGEVKKVTGNTGETLLVNATNLQSR